MLVFLGQFTAYTFISLLLLTSGVVPAFVGPLLLACGACGLLGLWYAGRGLDRNPRRTAVAVLAVMMEAVVVLGSHLADSRGSSCRDGGLERRPSAVCRRSTKRARSRTHAGRAERAGAWIDVTANVGIAGGAAIGAGLLQTAGLLVATVGGRLADRLSAWPLSCCLAKHFRAHA